MVEHRIKMLKWNKTRPHIRGKFFKSILSSNLGGKFLPLHRKKKKSDLGIGT
jgi:hypothetical protein